MCGTHESLAQVHNWTNEDGESGQQTHYFHCDQIDIPREMIDKDGNLLWYGEYNAWGRLKEGTRVTDSSYHPFRLKTSMPTVRRGCITTSSGIMSLRRDGLWIRTRLGWQVRITCISLGLMYWDGLISGWARTETIDPPSDIKHKFQLLARFRKRKKCLRQGLNWIRIQLLV